MPETSMIKKKETMQREPLSNCHEGSGALDWTNVLGDKDTCGKHLNFLHDDILQPGVSIGLHQHKDDEEYYYIISGKGMMILDEKEYEVKAGDVTAVYPGGKHGLENNSSEDLRVIVFSVSEPISED